MVQVGGEEQANIPDFGWETAGASVKGDRQEGKARRGRGQDVPPLSLSPRGRFFQAHFGPGKAGRPESEGAQAHSGG